LPPGLALAQRVKNVANGCVEPRPVFPPFAVKWRTWVPFTSQPGVLAYTSRPTIIQSLPAKLGRAARVDLATHSAPFAFCAAQLSNWRTKDSTVACSKCSAARCHSTHSAGEAKFFVGFAEFGSVAPRDASYKTARTHSLRFCPRSDPDHAQRRQTSLGNLRLTSCMDCRFPRSARDTLFRVRVRIFSISTMFTKLAVCKREL
jgi:hypothetical protein